MVINPEQVPFCRYFEFEVWFKTCAYDCERGIFKKKKEDEFNTLPVDNLNLS